MKTMGFPISRKENEKRRAIVPSDLEKIDHPEMLYFETGYGSVLGYSDNDYEIFKVNVVERKHVFDQEIICDPKIGDADYMELLKSQTIFGWIHAVQNRDITNKIINGKLTAYAWEDMFEEGRHIFWRNNEVAGEAAIMHAFQCYGMMPYNAKVALIGRGNVGNGALKILTLLGANVTTYNRRTEELLRKELPKFDVIVNAILWDTARTDHIIYRDDLKRMKPGAMIIDISCDRNGGIESSIPTTIDDPTYYVDNIFHYAVDHTPSLFFRTISKELSAVLPRFINHLISSIEDNVLSEALIINNGKIIDKRIIRFQDR